MIKPNHKLIIIRGLALFLILANCTQCTYSKDKIKGKYVAFYYETNFEYEFGVDEFTFTSYGHYGEALVKGKYKIVNDQLTLFPDYPNEQIKRDGVLHEKITVDRKNNCLLMEDKYVYCTNYQKSQDMQWELKNKSKTN